MNECKCHFIKIASKCLRCQWDEITLNERIYGVITVSIPSVGDLSKPSQTPNCITNHAKEDDA